jgi:hypothetical protein
MVAYAMRDKLLRVIPYRVQNRSKFEMFSGESWPLFANTSSLFVKGKHGGGR